MARSASAKRRGGSTPSIAVFRSSSGTRDFASAISTRLYSSMRFRISTKISPVRYDDQLVEHRRGATLVDRSGGKANALGKIACLAGNDKTGAGVHQNGVAIGAGLALEQGTQGRRVER